MGRRLAIRAMPKPELGETDGGDGVDGRIAEVHPRRTRLRKYARDEVTPIKAWCVLFPHIVSERQGKDGR